MLKQNIDSENKMNCASALITFEAQRIDRVSISVSKLGVKVYSPSCSFIGKCIVLQPAQYRGRKTFNYSVSDTYIQSEAKNGLPCDRSHHEPLEGGPQEYRERDLSQPYLDLHVDEVLVCSTCRKV